LSELVNVKNSGTGWFVALVMPPGAEAEDTGGVPPDDGGCIPDANLKPEFLLDSTEVLTTMLESRCPKTLGVGRRLVDNR
jgi:hypothetical protein